MIYISIVVQLSRKIIKHVYNEPVYVADGGETMAYSELIKNFNKIRDYMRDFYVYGFKSRDDYTKKSARSYDDEKRRIESWLGEYMKFHQTADGKNVFLSIDSRVTRHNPLYKACDRIRSKNTFVYGSTSCIFRCGTVISSRRYLRL